MFFKTKDLMTVGNIMGGLVASFISTEGMRATNSEQAWPYVFWAGVSILVAYAFDALDGVVARALHQQNKFGGEFDNVADLIAYSVAPGFIIYLVYRKIVFVHMDPAIAMVLSMGLAAIPPLFGCIRFARFNTFRYDIEGFWMGYPRPASALLLVSMVESDLFMNNHWMQLAGIAVIVMLGLSNVTLLPYIGHHGRRFTRHLGWILIYVAASVAVSLVLGLAGWLPRRVVFDVTFLYMFFYLTINWVDIPKQTRQEIKAAVATWKGLE